MVIYLLRLIVGGFALLRWLVLCVFLCMDLQMVFRVRGCFRYCWNGHSNSRRHRRSVPLCPFFISPFHCVVSCRVLLCRRVSGIQVPGLFFVIVIVTVILIDVDIVVVVVVVVLV